MGDERRIKAHPKLDCLRVRLGFAQTGHSISSFPLPAPFENLDTLEAFQNVSLCPRSAGGPQTTML
jgi:hypothetical protein